MKGSRKHEFTRYLSQVADNIVEWSPFPRTLLGPAGGIGRVRAHVAASGGSISSSACRTKPRGSVDVSSRRRSSKRWSKPRRRVPRCGGASSRPGSIRRSRVWSSCSTNGASCGLPTSRGCLASHRLRRLACSTGPSAPGSSTSCTTGSTGVGPGRASPAAVSIFVYASSARWQRCRRTIVPAASRTGSEATTWDWEG